MSIFLEALSWLTTPANWLGESGILTRSAEHLGPHLPDRRPRIPRRDCRWAR